MDTKIELTLAEKIDRARDGRTQTWIINKMKDSGFNITDTQFSRKKNGLDGGFSEIELKAISDILPDFKA